MTTNYHTILKNIGALLGSQLITWGLTLTLTIFLPHYLGASGMGQIQFATAIWAMMSVLIAFGTDTLLIKEIARRPEQAAALLGQSMALRIAIFVVSCGLVGCYLWFSQASTEVATLVFILGIAAIVGQLANVTDAALRGLELMQFTSLSSIVSKAVYAGCSIALLLLGYGIYAVAAMTIASNLVTLIIQMVVLKRRVGLDMTAHGANTIRAMLAIMRAGMPYLLIGLMTSVYGQIDTFVIHDLVSPAELGWYSIAVQLYGTLLFIPVILATAVFPAMTRSYTNSSSEMPRIVSKTFDMMLLIAVPIGLGLLVVSDALIALIYGPEFSQVGPVLGLMGIVLIFMFQNIVLGQSLISADRQNVWTVMTLIAIVCTVVLDLLLVPLFQQRYGNGAMGGSVSYIITEAGILIAAIACMPRGTLGWANVWTAARIIIAGLAMAGGCWLFRSMFIGVPVVVGAVIYCGLILLLRVIPAEDFQRIGAFIQQARTTFRSRRMQPADAEGT
ncbi:MAG TPA: flippase [Roseiflexaceae bacterium]|jgi:O-antigen/teichoic acid export membrane protein|nr:flippase [Roseiflexaceae bacterium]